jgi:hypothetical protein
MGVANYPVNWLGAQSWATGQRITGLAQTGISVPVLAAGAVVQFTVAPPNGRVAIIVYDAKPTWMNPWNALSWEVSLAGDVLVNETIDGNSILYGIQNLLLVTTREPLRIRVQNNGAVDNLFDLIVHYCTISTDEDLDMVKAQLRQLGDHSQTERALADIRDLLARIHNLQTEPEQQVDLMPMAEGPRPSVTDIEDLRGLI